MVFERWQHFYRSLLLVLLLVCTKVSPCRAQDFVDHSPVFDTYFQTPYVFDPDLFQFDEKLYGVNVGHRSLTGAFKEVRTTYLTGYYVPKNHHVFSAKFLDSQEGDFFSKTWVGGNYAFEKELQPNLYAAVGVYLGYVRFAFAQSSANAAANSGGFDGKVSGGIHNGRFAVSVLLDQFTSTRLQPIGDGLLLQRNLQTFTFLRIGNDVDHRFFLSNWSRFLSDLGFRSRMSLSYTYRDFMRVALTVNENLGVSGFLGFTSALSSGRLMVGFNYFFPSNNYAQLQQPQLFEVLGGYRGRAEEKKLWY